MRIYEEPTLEISTLASSDIITISGGDTQYDEIGWGNN